MNKATFITLKDKLTDYFALTGFLIPQADAEQSIREGVSFRGPNILILMFAIIIASLGLNTNSTAVIIGAMLISPLMGPIIGIGLGVGVQDFALIQRSVRNLSVAAVLSVLASCIYFLISPVSSGHSELLARTSPSIYDVFIGFFGGFAGIVGIASKNKGNVIPGVAIATALMPPLCTAGYGLATMQMNYFLGATYLFLINSIYIALATFIGVKLMKYDKVETADTHRGHKVRRIVYTIAVLTLIPSIYLTIVMYHNERFIQNADLFVSKEFHFPSTQVLTHTVSTTRGDRTITVTLIGKVLPEDSLQLAMNAKLEYYGLKGAHLDIVQGDASHLATLNEMSGRSMRDIFEIAQATINRKQAVIDSLQAVASRQRAADSISARLAPELKVVFPQVADIAVDRAVFGDVTTQRLDTLNVALVHFATPMGAAQRDKLSRYLEARLGVKSVMIVPVTLPKPASADQR